jgi:hypothetical protein
LIAGGDATALSAFVTATRALGRLDLLDGRNDDALALLTRAVPIAEAALSRAGDRAPADERAQLPRLYQTVALVHARLGHAAEARQWHDRAEDAWRSLAASPGFTDTLRREMNAPESLP